MKRVFDFGVSTLGLLMAMPIILALGAWIVVDSRGGMFYRQTRIGLKGRSFSLLKLRSMDPTRAPEERREITIGTEDPRITRPGRFIRKTKLDELPQLLNVMRGDMSLVGPRPEVPQYVALYNNLQRNVLNVRPGLTDPASIEAFDEPAILATAEDPERLYIEEIMPRKIELQLAYIEQASWRSDLAVLWRTLVRIFSSSQN
ncbi:MAG: sugar transferase [Flavobacteriales bacterium]